MIRRLDVLLFGVLGPLGPLGPLGLACSERRAQSEEPAPRASEYAQTSVGDRVRMRMDPQSRFAHIGISARDAAGRFVVFGTDRTQISLVEVSDDAVYLVSPTGERLVPQIVGPLRPSATTRYSIAQGEGRGECTLTIEAIDRSVEIAGTRLTRCIEQRRRCALPAGGGLPQPTTLDEHETLCPKIGLVRRHFRADPPLPFEGVPSEERTELVGFAVAGAPTPDSSPSLENRLIVMPTDLAAACNAAVSASELRASATTATSPALSELIVPSDAKASDVLLAFQLPSSRVIIEAREGSAAELDAYLHAPTTGESGAETRIGFATQSALVRISGASGCPRASGLEDLLRSLLR